MPSTANNSSHKYEVHPAANLFPMMSEAEYQGLKADIAENGQRESIVVWCNQLIDGRNRLRAMEDLGRQPDIAELDEDQDPWKYVISHNLHRRHLSTSQRALIAAKMANLKNGSNQHKKEGASNEGATSVDNAASLLNVSVATVERAKQVIKSGDAKVIAAVEQGDVTVNKAVTLVLKKPAKKPKQPKVQESASQQVKPAARVTIDSGALCAQDRFDDIPKERWRQLVSEKRNFLATRIKYDCKCLLDFCVEAHAVWSELGFESAEDMICNGYEINPVDIDMAAAWLTKWINNDPQSYEITKSISEVQKLGGAK